MTPEEQDVHTEFEIKRMERAHLETVLARYGLIYDRRLIDAIEGYACAKARAALAISREVQARKA